MKKIMKKINKSGFFSVIFVITAYMIIREIKQSPSMPSLSKIFNSAVEIFSNENFYSNLFYTIKIVFFGIIISFIAGTLIAIICSMKEWIGHLIMPIINSTKNIPSIALFPLFIVIMGIGDAPRIFVIIWNSVYPIISSTFVGLNSPEPDVIDAAKNCGASNFHIFVHIRIPISILDMLNGLKISVGNGFIAIVVAEMLGATKGLGYMVLWSANAFQYPQMYVYILVIALIGLIINVVIDKIIKRVERKMYYEDSKKNHVNRIVCFDDVSMHHRMWKRRIVNAGADSDNGEVRWEDEVCRTKSL